MLSPNEQMALVEERKRQLLHEARMHRLLLQAEQDRPLLGERLMGLLGDLMISGGRKLKDRSLKERSAIRYSVEAQNL